MEEEKVDQDGLTNDIDPQRIAAVLTEAQDEASALLLAAQDRAVAVLLEAQDRASALVLSAASRASVEAGADEDERKRIYTEAAERLLREQEAAAATLLKSQREAAARLLHAHVLIQDQLNAATKPKG